MNSWFYFVSILVVISCCHCVSLYINRHILASLHFNENVQRQTKISVDGEEYLKVTYPKFKLGDEVVREVTVPPTFGMFPVSNTQGCFLLAALFHMVPPSLSSQFKDRMKKADAVESYKKRQKRQATQLYPAVET